VGKPYLDTLARMEPDIAMVDAGGAYASVAISLKRIADALEILTHADKLMPLIKQVGEIVEKEKYP